MIQYKEVKDRGFKRLDLGGDDVWFNIHGYEWFMCEKVLFKGKTESICASWQPDDMNVLIQRVTKDGNIKATVSFESIEEYDNYVKLF
jgi:hypothetical protein